MKSLQLRPYLIGAAAGAVLAFMVGWWLWRPVSIHETAAPARELPSGALLVERAPDARAPEPVKVAAKEAGGKLVRSVSLTVQPEPIIVPAESTYQAARSESAGMLPETESAPVPVCSCEQVTIDLGLVRMPDRSHRVVATAKGGAILSAIDIPIEPMPAARSTRWAAGATVTMSQGGRREYGAFLDRDLGPFRLGVEVGQRDGSAAVTLRAGIRF